jgi:hypothetical protein
MSYVLTDAVFICHESVVLQGKIRKTSAIKISRTLIWPIIMPEFGITIVRIIIGMITPTCTYETRYSSVTILDLGLVRLLITTTSTMLHLHAYVSWYMAMCFLDLCTGAGNPMYLRLPGDGILAPQHVAVFKPYAHFAIL